MIAFCDCVCSKYLQEKKKKTYQDIESESYVLIRYLKHPINHYWFSILLAVKLLWCLYRPINFYAGNTKLCLPPIKLSGNICYLLRVFFIACKTIWNYWSITIPCLPIRIQTLMKKGTLSALLTTVSPPSGNRSY